MHESELTRSAKCGHSLSTRRTYIGEGSGLERPSMLINRLIAPLTAATVAVLTLGQAAHADLLIKVDKSAQRMTVTVDGNQLYDWPVSTGGPATNHRAGPLNHSAWTSTTTARSGTMRRCLIRFSSQRPATPCMAPTSSAISEMRCRTAAFGCR